MVTKDLAVRKDEDVSEAIRSLQAEGYRIFTFHTFSQGGGDVWLIHAYKTRQDINAVPSENVI